MDRITIAMPDELGARLRLLAAERGLSMATIVREAIYEKLAAMRPKPRSLGIGSSGGHDTAPRSADERPEPRSWR